MKTADFDYYLPPNLIAQTPIEPRDSSRLMVLNREVGSILHADFHNIGQYLHENDVLVVNKTKVINARLYGRKVPTGGKVELLLLGKQDEFVWEVLVGGKGLIAGKRIAVDGGPAVEIIQDLGGAKRLVRFARPIESYLVHIGNVPLPPYIHKELKDPTRYQTVFAIDSGSAAAPTAGLHFTNELIKGLEAQGIRFAYITLHIGLDTFAPVEADIPNEHKIHSEWCQVPGDTVEMINQARKLGGRIIAVGTTSARTLESAVDITSQMGRVGIYDGYTDLFILPGYKFRMVDAMITNFHLPRSTLIMMVSAFAGHDLIMEAYQAAIKLEYRFYSFGDAMLII